MNFWKIARRDRRTLACAGLLLVLAGCGKSDPASPKPQDKDADSGISLTGDEQKSLGIATAPAQATVWRRSVSGYGIVAAIDTIAQSDADVATASAAAAQSGAAAQRARSLATGEEAAVSREVAEVANAKAQADQAALALARRKAQAAFGIHAPWHSAAERTAIMAKLSQGRAVLVRVTFPLGSLGGMRPQRIVMNRLGDAAKTWESRQLWEAPADANLPGQGFYAILDGSDLAQNEHVSATVDVGPAEQGLIIPQAAVLIGESDTWVFVEPKAGHFEQVRINANKLLPGGYFVGTDTGIKAGEAVVTGGAGLLLARAANPASGGGD